MTLNLLLLILAFVAFVLATIGIASRVNLTAFGLAFWVQANILRVLAVAAVFTLVSCAGTGEGGAWTAGDTNAAINAAGNAYNTGNAIYHGQPVQPQPTP